MKSCWCKVVPLFCTVAPLNLLAVDPELQVEMQKLTASDGVAGDRFGSGVAIDPTGTIAVVGARIERGVYIYQRFDNGTPANPFDDTFVEIAKLTPSTGSSALGFGESVSIDAIGNTIITGARGQTD